MRAILIPTLETKTWTR